MITVDIAIDDILAQAAQTRLEVGYWVNGIVAIKDGNPPEK